MKQPEPIPFELVGGPHDGQIHFLGPGALTIFLPHGQQVFQYVRGTDNRFHFKPVGNQSEPN